MNSEVLSYAELVVRERREREELEQIRKDLEETRALLSEMEKWWKDSSQANAVLTARLHAAAPSNAELYEAIKEERRQKTVWREAYESVTGSKSWRMISNIKKAIGKK